MKLLLLLLNRLRAALDEKQEIIRNLEDERNSYKVALNLLTKEFVNSETQTMPGNQEQKENSFKVVTNKNKNKNKKKPGPKTISKINYQQ